MILTLLGGIGLFLLGMVLLTDGLKAVAGDALRRILSTFVKGPVSAISSGTLVTVLVQSSSATTLATIGFVSAGLLTFPQTIGVLLGAKLGTTSTGWLVTLLGLRFSISAFALPLIGVGALMRLLAKGRLASGGLALAGFGLIFIGIDTLQTGMEEFREVIDLTAFSGATIIGRLLLVAMGILMTVIMQSSSAAVATTLTALFAGAIDINQAAALVIGQNFGTAVTAIIAIIGASTPAVRTGVAYTLFSGIIAAVAFLLLPFYTMYVQSMGITENPSSAAISIAAFHTLFNFVGILVIIPFREQLSRIVADWVPEKANDLTRRLDKSVANVPSFAIEAVHRTVKDLMKELMDFSYQLTEKNKKPVQYFRLEMIEQAVIKTNDFLTDITTDSSQKSDYKRYLATLHAFDHVQRLLDACKETVQTEMLYKDPKASEMLQYLRTNLKKTMDWLDGKDEKSPDGKLKKMSKNLAEDRKKRRVEILKDSAKKGIDSADTLQHLDGIRWIDRIGYHTWRAVYHLSDIKEYEQDPPYPH